MFDEVVTANGFKENILDQCIYMKVNGRKYIFLVLYVDDILGFTYLLCRLRQNIYCLAIFYIKDIGEASYVLGIQILRDKPSSIMRLSQHTLLNTF